jgi:hypothetical protein
MGTTEILKEIKKLPVQKQMLIIERTLKALREQELHNKMRVAASNLREHYVTDHELSEFTVLDSETFYETR